ncbi:MAG TPA: NAD(P)H-dependent oxidoreductase [Chitinophagaceae bacterium]|jgi:FMN-dependent NADH-azoreductase|nr:NAD(P)H-dependent oxidoreductase [Chitinophagaceae bacterium]
MNAERSLRILRLDSSARSEASLSRRLTGLLIEKLSLLQPALVTERPLAEVPLLNEAAVTGMFLPAEKRTIAHYEALTPSDILIAELRQSDVLVIGAPVYNFFLPAALKAYIDQVVRFGVTFRLGASGAQGLLPALKAYVIITSEGTEYNSAVEFGSRYLRFVLNYIGISDVHFIDATNTAERGREAVETAAAHRMDALLQATEQAA